MVLTLTPKKTRHYNDGQVMVKQDNIAYEILGYANAIIAVLVAAGIFWAVATEGAGMAIAVGVVLVVGLIAPLLMVRAGDELEAWQIRRKQQAELDKASGVK